MSHLHCNEERDYSEENTQENEVFRSTILYHRKRLIIFTTQMPIYYIQQCQNRKSRLVWWKCQKMPLEVLKKVFFKISENSQETPVSEETPVNFAKIFRTHFLQSNSGRLQKRSKRNRLSLLQGGGCNAYCFG